MTMKKCPFCGQKGFVNESKTILKTSSPSKARNVVLVEEMDVGISQRRKMYISEQTKYVPKCTNKDCIAYSITRSFWSVEEAIKSWNQRKGGKVNED